MNLALNLGIFCHAKRLKHTLGAVTHERNSTLKMSFARVKASRLVILARFARFFAFGGAV